MITKPIHALVLSGALLTGLALTGCAHGYGYYNAYVGPPAPYAVGPVGYAPAPGYVWVDGFWDRRDGRWAWAQGYWARPPRQHAHWERPRWERHGNGWRFHQGRWR